MKSVNFQEELSLLIRSKCPIIYVVTWEEERAEKAIAQVAQECGPPRQVLYYDMVKGFEHNQEGKNNLLQALQIVENSDRQTATIYVFRDLHRRLASQRLDEILVRQLRNLYRSFRNSRKTLVLLSPLLEMPTELEEQISVLYFPLPETLEIRNIIEQMVPSEQLRMGGNSLEQLIKACMGMTRDRICHTLSKSMVQKHYLNESDIDRVLIEKQKRIRQTEFLEFFTPSETLDSIGGLDNFKLWLMQRQQAFSDEARAFGLPNPRGVLLLGIQGTGKSLCAKAIANLWRLPLLRLDVGRLFGSLVGQSESRTRQTIQLAEALAPCILWIDEIDKAFGGIANSMGDSGTSQRVLGTLLTWMQEKSSPVFVVATANNIHALPPELLRKGRFDELFFINLPTFKERKEIFLLHLKRFRPMELRSFNIEQMAEISKEFSGAEIEQAIVEGMYRAFHEQRDVITDDIIAAIKETYPLASTAREQISFMQAWAVQGRARSASSGELVEKARSKHRPLPLPPLPQVKSNGE
jgi:SpoVK/Ycf46/Vps4 family AAA+-type ATPase